MAVSRCSPALITLFYSSFMTLFGQFFDQGLDFLQKGQDVTILIPLQPEILLENHPHNAIRLTHRSGARGELHIEQRQSVATLGLVENRDTVGKRGVAEGQATRLAPSSPSGLAHGGVLILNNVAVTVTVVATSAARVAAINAVAGGNVLEGGAGHAGLKGGSGNDGINGGAGAAFMTGGNGSDVFPLAAGDSGQEKGFDIITDFSKGSMLIQFASNLKIGESVITATATQASINMATGVAAFAAGSGGSPGEALADIALAFSGDDVQMAGEFALFQLTKKLPATS